MCQRVRQPLYLCFIARASHSCPVGFRRKGARSGESGIKKVMTYRHLLYLSVLFFAFIFAMTAAVFSAFSLESSTLLFLSLVSFFFLISFVFFFSFFYFSHVVVGFRILVFVPGSRLSCAFFIHSFCTACVFDSVVPPKSFITRQVTCDTGTADGFSNSPNGNTIDGSLSRFCGLPSKSSSAKDW